METLDFLDRFDSELVIGLVAPVGTEKSIVIEELKDSLKSFGYGTRIVKLSGFLEGLKDKHEIKLIRSPEHSRINSYMDAGNKVRAQMGRGDALALWAINEIANLRESVTDGKIAYILDSLKHPEEIQTLRRVYGSGFFLIGIYSPKEKRFEYLNGNKGIEEEKANELIKRDHHEDFPDDYGQNTRETFYVSDAFVSLINPEEARSQIVRVIDLIFGHPFYTPTRDEFAMFHAFTAKLRSADLSRQVGAVILSEQGELIGIGANDVPSYGGGLYWPGTDDHRDYEWGYDSNAKRRDQMLSDIVQLVKEKTSSDKDEQELLKEVKAELSHSILLDITEFGRPVHAEMEAILSCARIGVSPGMGTLYCTTFPCHNCAKHIVAAGIKKVVYVEPYPKSKAQELHSDSIEVDKESGDDRVSFVPFVGVGSRKFIDLFSMGLNSGFEKKRKPKHSIHKIEWNRGNAKVRVPMLRTSYIEREKAAAKVIDKFYQGATDEKKAE
jgi:deoxycytidylate deaminase